MLNLVSIFKSSIASTFSGSAIATTSVVPSLHMGTALYCLAIFSGTTPTSSFSILYLERFIAGILKTVLITVIKSFSPIKPFLTSIVPKVPPCSACMSLAALRSFSVRSFCFNKASLKLSCIFFAISFTHPLLLRAVSLRGS